MLDDSALTKRVADVVYRSVLSTWIVAMRYVDELEHFKAGFELRFAKHELPFYCWLGDDDAVFVFTYKDPEQNQQAEIPNSRQQPHRRVLKDF